MPELSNFDHWWTLYRTGCTRMASKDKCKKKFERFSLELQRTVYKDTQDRLDDFEGWKELDSKGKRKYMQGPHPYLVAAPWETPLDTKTAQRTLRDTTEAYDPPKQRLLGLRQFRDKLHNDGLPTMSITEQINKLKRSIDENAIA